MFEEDASAFSLFNRALFAFKTEGDTTNANQLLSNAMKANKFIAKKHLAKKPITKLAGYYSPGDENEADYYALYAQGGWTEIKGAKAWLKKYQTKS